MKTKQDLETYQNKTDSIYQILSKRVNSNKSYSETYRSRFLREAKLITVGMKHQPIKYIIEELNIKFLSLFKHKVDSLKDKLNEHSFVHYFYKTLEEAISLSEFNITIGGNNPDQIKVFFHDEEDTIDFYSRNLFVAQTELFDKDGNVIDIQLIYNYINKNTEYSKDKLLTIERALENMDIKEIAYILDKLVIAEIAYNNQVKTIKDNYNIKFDYLR